MSSIVTDRGIVHYETIGRRGRPVILLHCWLGSWNYWLNTMEYLAQYKIKTYALDFWGFGDSAKQGVFSVNEYVDMVVQFMERLGLEHGVPVMGHSMGGSVSLALTLKRPDLVSKVAIVGSPINGTGLSTLLKVCGSPFMGKVLYTVPGMLTTSMRALSTVYAKDWRTLADMLSTSASRATMESFSNSINDLHHTDLTPRLHELQVPTMGIFGRKDNIVSPKQGKLLLNGVSNTQVYYFEHSGHFPMLDETDRFHQTIHNFLTES